ncbi:MAG: hypothetical protein ACPHCN_15080, partial [Mycobacterium sp.]
MEVLRSVVVLFHIVAFAITFGAWVAEAAAGRFRMTRVMDYGLKSVSLEMSGFYSLAYGYLAQLQA